MATLTIRRGGLEETVPLAIRERTRLANLLPPGGLGELAWTVNRRPVGLEDWVAPGDVLELEEAPRGPFPLLLPYIGLYVAGPTLLNLALAPDAPNFGDDEEAGRGRLGRDQSTTGPGSRVPLLYGGPFKTFGHVIESFTEVAYEYDASGVELSVLEDEDSRRVNTQIVFGLGPVESVDEFDLDGSPIELFTGVTSQTFLGGNDQGPADGFDESKASQRVAQLVENLSPISRFSGGPVFRFEVEVYFSKGLWQVQSNKLRDHEVEIRVEYRVVGEATWTALPDITMVGRSRSPFARYVRSPEIGGAAVEVRVSRLTADDDPESLTEASDVRFETLVDVVGGGRVYPGWVRAALRTIPREQSGIWQRARARIKGSNEILQWAEPDASDATRGWTDNPAWIAADFILDQERGLRFYELTDLDTASVLEAANHCISKGLTFGAAIDGATRGEEVLRQFEAAGSFQIIEEGGWIRFVPDAPADPSFYFTEGNYREGSLSYEFVPARAPNKLVGRFRNAAQDYEEDAVSVSLPTAQGEPPQELTITFPGVTDATQVSYLLAVALRRLELETMRVTFTLVGPAAMRIRVGDVFGLSSISDQSCEASGRLLAVSGDRRRVRLDREVELDQGQEHELFIEDAQGAHYVTIRAPDHRTEWLEVDSDPGWDPRPGDLYSVGEIERSIRMWRCESRRLEEDGSVLVRARNYDAGVYDVEDLVAIWSSETPRVVREGEVPGAVRELVAVSRDSGLDVSWLAPEETGNLARYAVFLAETGGRYREVGTPATTSLRYEGELESGQSYTVAVVALSSLGRRLHIQDATSIDVTV